MWNMYRLKRFGPVFKCPKSTCRSVANHQGRETMCSTSNGIQKGKSGHIPTCSRLIQPLSKRGSGSDPEADISGRS